MAKKIFCFILIASVILITTVSASAYDYNSTDVIIDFLPGDIDGNGSVNALDARLCLRAAAQFETLTDTQKKAADLDGTGKITSITARSILRAGAGLENLNVTITIEKGQNLVIGPMQIWGIKCELKEQNDNVSVTKTTDIANPDVAGVPAISFFTINATASGSYNLSVISQQPWNTADTTHYEIVLNIK